MTIILRKYQKQILNKLWLSLKKNNRILVCAPTGSGKTVMASVLIKELVKRNKRVAFIVDSEELILQSKKTFGEVSIIKAGYEELYNPSLPVQLIMIQTFYARKDKLPDLNIDYIIVDECHIGWQNVRMVELLNIYPDAKIVGLSATPINNKGYLLHSFDDFINEVQVKDLIELGYLAKPITYIPSNCVLDLSNVSLTGYEYNNKQVDEIVLDINKVDSIVNNWEQVAKNKKTIVFANSIKHAEMINNEFVNRGYDSVVIHSKLDNLDEVRLDIKNHLIVVNVAILTKGYDDKNIECVVMASPTNILSNFIQKVGRGLRVTENKKECIFIDCANCINHHGGVDDLRFYEFEKSKEKDECPYIQCPECGHIQDKRNLICEMCGYEFGAIPEEQVSTTKQSKKQIEALIKAKSLQDELRNAIEELGKERNYKRGWSWFLFKDVLKLKRPTESALQFFKRKMTKVKKIKKKGYNPNCLRYE